jgi:hypothetical protein
VALKRLLASDLDDEVVRLEGAVALLRLGDVVGVPALIRLMGSADRSVRMGAQVAFGRYTHRDFGYRFDASTSEREAVLEEIQAWWETAGRDFTLPGS